MNKEDRFYNFIRSQLEEKVGKRKSDYFFINVLYKVDYPDNFILHDGSVVKVRKGDALNQMIELLNEQSQGIDFGEEENANETA